MNFCCLRSKTNGRSLSIASSRIQDRIRQDTAFNCKSDPEPHGSALKLRNRNKDPDPTYADI